MYPLVIESRGYTYTENLCLQVSRLVYTCTLADMEKIQALTK